LNRRGYSSFLMCRDCGFVLKCPNCDISQTLHMDTHSMKCHYCGHEEAIPKICPSCHSSKIRYFGTGTQKVEEEINKLLQKANITKVWKSRSRYCIGDTDDCQRFRFSKCHVCRRIKCGYRFRVTRFSFSGKDFSTLNAGEWTSRSW